MYLNQRPWCSPVCATRIKWYTNIDHFQANKTLWPGPNSNMVVKAMQWYPSAIKNIIETSLSSGIFPDILKEAMLKPMLKKMGLDPECFINFRPNNKFDIYLKLIECAVCNRYNVNMFNNDIADIYQLAYKPGHSVEMAIVCVHNDIV